MFSLMLYKCQGVGLGWGGRSFVGMATAPKKWRTVGQKVRYSGPKADVPRNEKWRTDQNVILDCYNEQLSNTIQTKL